MRRTLLQLALLTPVCVYIYARFIAADWLNVTHVTVKTTKLERGRTLKLAFISDLHFKNRTRAHDELEKRLRARQPDVLIYAGDTGGNEEALNILTRLPSKYGRFSVRGEGDSKRDAAGLLPRIVGRELGGVRPVYIGNQLLTLCGASHGATSRAEACLETAEASGTFTVFVHDSAELIETLLPRPDLYIAGQTANKLSARYSAGRYEVTKSTLYVSSGFGSPGTRRPELTFITIEGE